MTVTSIKDKSISDTDPTQSYIYLIPGEINDSCDDVIKTLIKKEPLLFTQDNRIVYVIEKNPSNKKEEYQGEKETSVIPVDKRMLADFISLNMNILKNDKRANDYKRTDCPLYIAESILARPKHKFPILTGLIHSPTMRRDYSLLEQPGYDNRTGLFMTDEIPNDYSPPPNKPTKKEAVSALSFLQELTSEFAFVGKEDESAYISLITSALLRSSMDSAPAGALTAYAPGTGKSIGCEVISIISTGKFPPTISQGKDEDETEKRYGAALLSGMNLILMDNIERYIKGGFLCQVTTQKEVSIRPLGSSTLVKIELNVSLLFNGNNLDIRGDMKRRVVLVRFDAKTERPEQKKFKRDVIKYTKINRGRLIEAVLTIPLAYKEAGSPDLGVTPYGGFSDWDKLCRLPLIWLGLPDPLLPSEDLREIDPDFVNQRQLYSAWFQLYESNFLTASEIICGADDQIRGVLNTVCYDKLTTRVLGGWLRKHKGRIIDGLKLESTLDTHTKTNKWRLIKCG